jgi:hypothetical protein
MDIGAGAVVARADAAFASYYRGQPSVGMRGIRSSAF